MTQCGTLEVITYKDDSPQKISGAINELRGDYAIALDVAETRGPRSPSHEVRVRRKDGTFLPVGVAWRRDTKSPEQNGQHMFSIVIQHPQLPDFMENLAAFQDGVVEEFPDYEVTRYKIVMSRQRREQEETA